MSVSADHTVHIVYQSQDLSCWAACVAMMLSWRDSMSYDEEALIAKYPEFGTHGADDAGWEKLARDYGLQILSNASRDLAGWAEMVAKGPVMVGSPDHIVVACGIRGETFDDAEVHVLDPTSADDWWPLSDIEHNHEQNVDNPDRKIYYNNLFQW